MRDAHHKETSKNHTYFLIVFFFSFIFPFFYSKAFKSRKSRSRWRRGIAPVLHCKPRLSAIHSPNPSQPPIASWVCPHFTWSLCFSSWISIWGVWFFSWLWCFVQRSCLWRLGSHWNLLIRWSVIWVLDSSYCLLYLYLNISISVFLWMVVVIGIHWLEFDVGFEFSLSCSWSGFFFLVCVGSLSLGGFMTESWSGLWCSLKDDVLDVLSFAFMMLFRWFSDLGFVFCCFCDGSLGFCYVALVKWWGSLKWGDVGLWFSLVEIRNLASLDCATDSDGDI